jgi:hypothetical protein
MPAETIEAAKASLSGCQTRLKMPIAAQELTEESKSGEVGALDVEGEEESECGVGQELGELAPVVGSPARRPSVRRRPERGVSTAPLLTFSHERSLRACFSSFRHLDCCFS